MRDRSSTEESAISVGRSTMARRAAIGSAVGSALEWLDFTAYGAVSATVLPRLFFPTLDANTAILASFATFGVGFCARPAGGIVFGLLGDRVGRKNVLLVTFALMGVSSMLIGLMPPYSSIGIWAPALIVLLRFVQGFALGGESTGAQLFAMEHAPAGRRGLYGSFVNMAAPASQVLANGMLVAISSVLDDRAFLQFGWRIPFLMSVLLILLGLYLRSRVSETPAFEALKARQVEVAGSAVGKPKVRVRDHWRTILRLLIFWGGPASCYYVVTVFSITFIVKHGLLSTRATFLCLMSASVVAVGTTILGGAATDRFGRKPPLIVASIVMLVTSCLYFRLLETGSVVLTIVAMSLFAGSIQAQSGILPSFFSEQFPTSARYAGSALAYTGANLLFASPTPFVAAWVTQRSEGSTAGVTAICVGLVSASLLALMISPETRFVDVDAPE
ncbi:MFS transporter [Sphingomonas sp. BIUV-7]|uniref:MFS transporter n=1 Tax=Sphingomonas natans TaxID=3063330 RepID=A0ABT8YAA9_9SPHN|nr:MFS transporter [Sphingomonas sp. BIUV-7]MDO6415266.1 MFS transporter [Sphingomonas sp. BIUV-7]